MRVHAIIEALYAIKVALEQYSDILDIFVSQLMATIRSRNLIGYNRFHHFFTSLCNDNIYVVFFCFVDNLHHEGS